MSINDNGIMEALKENPQNGFRMLMAKYQESVYWHIRRSSFCGISAFSR